MKTVFIVDDDPNVIRGLINHIPWDDLNIRVLGTAVNGEEALHKIEQQKPDIVITDIYMPKMDGLALIQALRQKHPSIHIIIHSGYEDFDNARLAMKFGVRHFFLKPVNVYEFETVIKEVIMDMEANEKQKKLQEYFDKQMKQVTFYLRDAFFREMLITRYRPAYIPEERLNLLGLSRDANVVVASLYLIRSPYLSKSREREWQLLKFGAGNIIKEMVGDPSVASKTDVHVVDYKDSTFVIVFMAKEQGLDLEKMCKKLISKMIRNILIYLKLSLIVGLGQVKSGIHEIIDSYLESQKALEAGEYKEINRVFTYDELKEEDESEPYEYPLEMQQEMQTAVHERDPERLMEAWRKFEQDVRTNRHIPLFVVQNVCTNVLSAIMIDNYSRRYEQKNGSVSRDMSEVVTHIYAQRSPLDLCAWMDDQLREWAEKVREEIGGKKSHKLIRDVKEYVQNHYDQEISLAEIADRLYVNRNYLSQLFKRVTGETFVNYLNRFRIEKAKELLREKHYMVYEVSEMVGYQNPTYFSQVFKSITGVSPSEYYK